MKQLLIIRHAKSSWATIGQNDFDRPLNERGIRDAPKMAERLLEKKISIDAFISSPAKRAITTAGLFAQVYQFNSKGIETIPQLYHAHTSVFYEVISQIEDSIITAALFSHNPGITEFVNELTRTKIDNMPTCGIFGITSATEKWKNFRKAERTFWFFDYPKT